MSRRILLGLLFVLFSVFSSASGAAPTTSNFLIKPYLFSIQGQKIAVGWAYTTPAPAQLTLFSGTTEVAQLTPQVDAELSFVELPIGSCDFGSDLSYQVTGMAAPQLIHEIPCSDSANPVTFSFLADSQEGPEYTHTFAEYMQSFNPNAILHGGDIVQTGTSSDDWVKYFAAMEAVGGSTVLYATPGNHEYRDDVTVPSWRHYFRSAAKDSHYVINMGSVQIIALNSNFSDDPSQNALELGWVEQQLSIPAKWRVIFFHHPAYSDGIANSVLAPKKEHVVLADYYVPLFEQYKVDLVLNGHVHFYERSLKNGVNYVTVGPAGGKMGVHGGDDDDFLVTTTDQRTIANVQVDEHSLQLMSVNYAGQVIDSLQLRK